MSKIARFSLFAIGLLLVPYGLASNASAAGLVSSPGSVLPPYGYAVHGYGIHGCGVIAPATPVHLPAVSCAGSFSYSGSFFEFFPSDTRMHAATGMSPAPTQDGVLFETERMQLGLSGGRLRPQMCIFAGFSFDDCRSWTPYRRAGNDVCAAG